MDRVALQRCSWDRSVEVVGPGGGSALDLESFSEQAVAESCDLMDLLLDSGENREANDRGGFSAC